MFSFKLLAYQDIDNILNASTILTDTDTGIYILKKQLW